MLIKRLYNVAQSSMKRFLSLGGISGMENLDSKNEDYLFFEKSFIGHKEPTFGSQTHPLAQYYANLEVPHGSSRQEIKAAWKRLMKRYHPDLHAIDPEKRAIASELTRQLTEAYKVLDRQFMIKD